MGFLVRFGLEVNAKSNNCCSGAEPEERGGVPQALERNLGGPPGLMKIFKLR